MDAAGGAQAGSQTLSRGIQLLEVLAASDRTLSIAALAEAVQVHRSVAYRLLRTLEEHDLVSRDGAGLFGLGAGLAALAGGVDRDLQVIALPVLTEIANEIGMTCLLAVALHGDEAVTLVSASPRQSVAVSYHPGHRHPITRGSPGKAILMGLDEGAWPADVSAELRAELSASRERGYAASAGEVIPSLESVGVPLMLPGQPPASIAAIHLTLDGAGAAIAARLQRGADEIAEAFGA